MVTTTHHISVEELERNGAPEGRWELINGELVAMAPAGGTHGRIEMEIGAPLYAFVKPRHLGLVYSSDTGFVLSENPPVVRMPDVGYVRTERLPPDHDNGKFLRVVPDLVVEVISPSDRMVDVLAKVVVWLEAGVSLVWVVAPVSKTVTVFSGDREPRTLTIDEVLDGDDIVPGFTLPVREIFAI